MVLCHPGTADKRIRDNNSIDCSGNWFGCTHFLDWMLVLCGKYILLLELSAENG